MPTIFSSINLALRALTVHQQAQAAGATVNLQDNGDALAPIGGHILVAGGEAQPIGVTADALNPGMVKVVWPADGLDATIQAGRLGGALKGRNIDIPARLSALDSLASNSFWADTVAQLGLDTQRAQDSEGAHSLISDALTKQKQSVTGVSLDEEAAPMLTAFDEMADTIINRMGVAGR